MYSLLGLSHFIFKFLKGMVITFSSVVPVFFFEPTFLLRL